jgi:hypothetical protein
MIGTAAALLASGLAAAGTSAAGAALSNKSKTTTQTSTPQLPPELLGTQNALISRLNGRLADPSAGLEPLKTAAISGINHTYQGIPERINESFASRGYANSGFIPKALATSEISRAGDVARLEPQFAQMALDRDQQSIVDSLGLLNSGRGITNSVTTPSNSLGAGIATAGATGSKAIQDWLAYQQLSSILQNFNKPTP